MPFAQEAHGLLGEERPRAQALRRIVVVADRELHLVRLEELQRLDRIGRQHVQANARRLARDGFGQGRQQQELDVVGREQREHPRRLRRREVVVDLGCRAPLRDQGNEQPMQLDAPVGRDHRVPRPNEQWITEQLPQPAQRTAHGRLG
jgi:hypothetical protein